ncbi:MAG: hypothetical protein H5T45_01510 [Thermoplasmatales archaeon]|nr:hypothetical protein [Thermoplasmatales archaeon]
MTTREELEQALIGAYKAKYGEDAIVKLNYYGTTEPNGIYHHWILWYRDEKGVIKANHDIYAVSFDGTNFEWFNKDPTIFEVIVPTPETFDIKIRSKLKGKVQNGELKYFEITDINSDIEKVYAKVVKQDGTKTDVICYLANEELVIEQI